MPSSGLSLHAHMRLLIDFRPLSGPYLDSKTEGYFTAILDRLAAANSGLKCVYLCDRIPSGNALAGPALENMIIRKSLPGIVGWKLWFDKVIPGIAEKIKADLVLHAGCISSLRMGRPQAVWIPRPPYGKAAEKEKSFGRLVLKKLSLTQERAAVIFTGSVGMKQTLCQLFPQASRKILVIPPAASGEFRRYTWEEKAWVRESLTAGKEYFLVLGQRVDPADLTDVLKAFSLFKKRQHSGVQLVISVSHLSRKQEFQEKLKTYKYRQEVQLAIGDAEAEIAKKLSAAYAVIQPDYHEPGLLQAFRSGAPVISLGEKYPETLCGDAVLYATPGSIESLAEQLKLLYKNEGLKTQLAQKGLDLEPEFSWQKSSGLLWTGLIQAIEGGHL